MRDACRCPDPDAKLRLITGTKTGWNVTRQLISTLFALMAALLLTGCGGTSDIFSGNVKLLPQGMGFSSQEWSKAPPAAEIALTRPVTAEDYVDASGVCAAAAQPNDAAAGTVAGDLAAAKPAPSPALGGGGVGLGMTECQVVQRAGQPNSVDIGSENNERKVVLTYAGGGSPGIYTFVGGRLKVIDQVAAPAPAKPAVKKRPAKPGTAARS
jgi:hypothetical protein